MKLKYLAPSVETLGTLLTTVVCISGQVEGLTEKDYSSDWTLEE